MTVTQPGPKWFLPKLCPGCGSKMPSYSPHGRKTCSVTCRVRVHRRRQAEAAERPAEPEGVGDD